MENEDEVHRIMGLLQSDADGLTVFAKGHVDKDLFCRAVEKNRGFLPDVDYVRHCWMHFGPHGDMRGSEHDYYQHLHKEGGRGRFKVTYCEVY